MDDDWVAGSCTLPTAERPLRVAEFDRLFQRVTAQQRPDRTRLVLQLSGGAETAAWARELAERETSCCSFFGFEVSDVGEDVRMTVTVPDGQVEVLDALAARASTVAAR